MDQNLNFVSFICGSNWVSTNMSKDLKYTTWSFIFIAYILQEEECPYKRQEAIEVSQINN